MRIRAVLVSAVAAFAVLAPAASAHEGNPNYRSEITGVQPGVEGLDAQVLNYDDSIQLTNDSGKEVVVYGYEDEPYLRITADGTVEVNQNSPAYYLNDDRFAQAEVPSSADPKAPPQWKEVDQTGQYSWHDHRAHYMAQGTPPQVKDDSVETKVFDYQIPIDVDGQPAKIDGTLTWVGQDEGLPILPFVILGIVALALVGLVIIVRRRRGAAESQDSRPSGKEQPEAREAW